MTEDNGIESLDVVLISEDTLIDLEDAEKQSISAEVEKAIETVKHELLRLAGMVPEYPTGAIESLETIVAALKARG